MLTIRIQPDLVKKSLCPLFLCGELPCVRLGKHRNSAIFSTPVIET